MQSVCEQPVFGIIKDLGVLPWNEKFHSQNRQVCVACTLIYFFVMEETQVNGILFSLQTQGKDLLLVVSDSGKLSFLTFCNEMHRF